VARLLLRLTPGAITASFDGTVNRQAKRKPKARRKASKIRPTTFRLLADERTWLDQIGFTLTAARERRVSTNLALRMLIKHAREQGLKASDLPEAEHLPEDRV